MDSESDSDALQSVLWCVHEIVSARRIKKPRNPEGLIVAEMNAVVELHMILEKLPVEGKVN